MAHCAHVLAPSCAWVESTEPKKRSHSIASRLGNAIRAMKPPAKRSQEERVTEEQVYVLPRCHKSSEHYCQRRSERANTADLNAAATLLIENCSLMKQALSDDEVSTESGGSRRSSLSLSTESGRSRLSSACLSDESVEEVQVLLPGSVEEILPSSSDFCDNEKDELHALATVIADHAQSKFSGRVYQDVRNAFLAVDANGDGKVTCTEALAFCQHFDVSPVIASRFFTLLDRCETGLADWSSFLAHYASVFTKKTDLRRNAGKGRKWPAIQ